LGEVRFWRSSGVQALFPGDADARGIVRSITAALAVEPSGLAVSVLQDRPWEREWLRDFHARQFGRRLWLSPHHEPVVEPGAAVVHLDPGLAFGTGSHPTTALCLEWLDANIAAGSRVIDYGCGSGVLGIAAARLGAGEVWCYDLDPQALTAARDNAGANALSAVVHVVDSAAQLPDGSDLVIANILASTLCQIAAQIAACVRPGGHAVLSGILASQEREVTHAYRTWFDTTRFGARDGWISLSAVRNANA
jgi:ribosomal protein L11 methyltransferase